MRRLLAACFFAGLLLAAPAAAQPPPGFQADLAGRSEAIHPECFPSDDNATLTCALYGVATSARCDFGGAVATVVLPRDAPATRGTICVDEGFHGWTGLIDGRAWRHAPFRCARWSEAASNRLRGWLHCFNATGRGFTVNGTGRIVLSADTAAAPKDRFCFAQRETVLPARVRVYARSTTCAIAKRIKGAYYSRGAPRGWRCFVQGTPQTDDIDLVLCRRRGSAATVRWTYE